MAHTIVIFGASGDLTSRKLIPALYNLFKKDKLDSVVRIVGVSRSKFEHEQFRDALRESASKFAGKVFDVESWIEFSRHLYYHSGDIKESSDFQSLAKFLDEIEEGQPAGRLYYLSTMPQLNEEDIKHIGAAGLADDRDGFRRVMI